MDLLVREQPNASIGSIGDKVVANGVVLPMLNGNARSLTPCPAPPQCVSDSKQAQTTNALSLSLFRTSNHVVGNLESVVAVTSPDAIVGAVQDVVVDDVAGAKGALDSIVG